MDGEKHPLPPTYDEIYRSNINQSIPPPGQQYAPLPGYPQPGTQYSQPQGYPQPGTQYPPSQGYPQLGAQYPQQQGYPQLGAQYPPTTVAATSNPYGNVIVVDQRLPPPSCLKRFRVLIIIMAFVLLSIFITYMVLIRE